MKNVKSHDRLFTFGCSFTQYHWPTWADILGREANYYENWALSGGGNDFILNRLVECNQRNSLTRRDLVIIMWSGVTREDHYTTLWKLRGNQYTCNDINWLIDNRSPQGYLLKSLNYITAAKFILDSIGCRYYFLSMLPVGHLEFEVTAPDATMLGLYQNVTSTILPSVFETVYQSNWDGPSQRVSLAWPGKKPGYDPHPVPSLHLEYLKKTFPRLRVSKDTENFVEQWNNRVLNLTVEDHNCIVDPLTYGRLYPLPKIKAF